MRQFSQRFWMIWIFLMAVIAYVATAGFAQDAPKPQAAQSTFTPLIAAEQASVKTGTDVWIVVTRENKSDHTISLYRALSNDQGAWVYKVQVYDEKGARAPKTQFGKDIQGPETPEEKRDFPEKSVAGSVASLPLAPGKTITDRVNVSKIYDLSRPGKYTITVRTLDGETRAIVESNSVTVTVTP